MYRSKNDDGDLYKRCSSVLPLVRLGGRRAAYSPKNNNRNSRTLGTSFIAALTTRDPFYIIQEIQERSQRCAVAARLCASSASRISVLGVTSIAGYYHRARSVPAVLEVHGEKEEGVERGRESISST